MLIRSIVTATLLIAAPLAAQTNASESAKKFNLDPSVLQSDDGVAAPAERVEGPPETPADEAVVAEEAPPAPEPKPEPVAASLRRLANARHTHRRADRRPAWQGGPRS